MLLPVNVSQGDQVIVILVVIRIISQALDGLPGTLGFAQRQVGIGHANRDCLLVCSFGLGALEVFFGQIKLLD